MRHEILQTHISSEGFVSGYRSRLISAYREVIRKSTEMLRTELCAALDVIQADLAVIQSPKGKERLFKTESDYGEECERAMMKIQNQMVEMEELTQTARAMAQQQYGYGQS